MNSSNPILGSSRPAKAFEAFLFHHPVEDGQNVYHSPDDCLHAFAENKPTMPKAADSIVFSLATASTRFFHTPGVAFGVSPPCQNAFCASGTMACSSGGMSTSFAVMTKRPSPRRLDGRDGIPRCRTAGTTMGREEAPLEVSRARHQGRR